MGDGNGCAEALLGLAGFRVVEVSEEPGEVVIGIETLPAPVGCPDCGVLAEVASVGVVYGCLSVADPPGGRRLPAKAGEPQVATEAISSPADGAPACPVPAGSSAVDPAEGHAAEGSRCGGCAAHLTVMNAGNRPESMVWQRPKT